MLIPTIFLKMLQVPVTPTAWKPKESELFVLELKIIWLTEGQLLVQVHVTTAENSTLWKFSSLNSQNTSHSLSEKLSFLLMERGIYFAYDFWRKGINFICL